MLREINQRQILHGITYVWNLCMGQGWAGRLRQKPVIHGQCFLLTYAKKKLAWIPKTF